MRVAIMAAGAVGGYFGARIATAGHDVNFVARGAHRDAIRRDGLRIESPLGDLQLQVKVTDDPAAIGRSISCCSRSSCGTPKWPRDRPARWSAKEPA